jgi:hypothetical protein
MNKFTAVLITVCLFLVGCVSAPPKLPLAQADREKTFTISTTLSKAEEKEKTLAFLGEYFVSSKSVIQSSEGDMIVGNYRYQIGKLCDRPLICDLTFIIKCSDGTIDCKLLFKQMKLLRLNGDEYDVDEYYGSYRNGLLKEYSDFQQKLSAYLSKPIF